MANDSKMKTILEYVMSLLAPGTQQASGAVPAIPALPAIPVKPYMDTRQATLQQLGPQQTGGMFDIIYKRKREMDKRLGEIEN